MVFQKRFYSPDDTGGAGSKDDGAGGAGDGSENDDGGAGDEGSQGDDDKPVARSDHRRALDDLNRFKKKASDEAKARELLQRKLDEAERKGKGEDIEDLKQRLADAETRSESLKAGIIKSEKNRALLPALTEAGLRADARKMLDHLDLDGLEVEISTHGNITVHGVAEFVKKVKREYPFAFEVKKAANVNGGGGGNSRADSGKDWTPTSLVELERTCKKKGDMKPYYEAVKVYQDQKKKA